MLLFEILIIWYINPANIDISEWIATHLYVVNVANVLNVRTYIRYRAAQRIFMFPDMSSLNTAKAIAIKFSELNWLAMHWIAIAIGVGMCKLR